jgi:D-alanine-D-alanine ligase
MKNKKKNIAVIFGGKSAEHDVSIITAHIPIIDSLLAIGEYNIYPIYISKEGVWYSDQRMLNISFFKEKNYINKLNNKNKISLNLNNGLEFFYDNFFAKKVKIDLVFPAMHGTFGEDGSLMGLLRMANVAFVGCDIFASTIAMDKVTTKQIVSSEGLPITKYFWFTREEFNVNKDVIFNKIKLLNFPLFVKPVHLGSSIGITKVKNGEELVNAIEVALFYDDKILVEEGVENLIEVTLPIIGNENLILGGVEKALNKTDFFDFEEKYLSGGGKKQNNNIGVNNSYSEIPAKIDGEFLNKVKEYGVKVYQVLGCSGIARIDFLINGKTKEVFVNEVNTLPGSLYAHNFKKMGITNIELVQKLIGFAEEKFIRSKESKITFESKILEYVGGGKKNI